MMFETNTDQNSPRISLSKAAQLTGYHQDYLGQLCRLGKLEAVKIGRNWFTSEDALNSLSSSSSSESVGSIDSVVPEIDSAAADVQGISDGMESIEDVIEISQPVISQNITVSEVDGMPIAIRNVPTQVKNTNSVQGILTNMRIENLQREVMELRQLLFRLMEEVKSHTSILQTHETINRVQDSLKHSYVSNFDFSMPKELMPQRSFAPRLAVQTEEVITPPIIWSEPHEKRYILKHWVAASAALAAISFITIGIATGNFFGTESVVTSHYYRQNLQTQTQPAVAGAENTLPTDSAGELIPVMIR